MAVNQIAGPLAGSGTVPGTSWLVGPGSGPACNAEGGVPIFFFNLYVAGIN